MPATCGAAIEVPSHGELLRRGLGVKIDDDRIGARLQPAGLKLPVHGLERTVEIGQLCAAFRFRGNAAASSA